MQGLRTPESDKFKNFFKLIQTEAKKQNSVFFIDAGDGNEFATSTMEGENLMGWLVPKEQASDFESLWKASNIDDSWSDLFVWAVWARTGNEIKIKFEG